MDNPQQQAIAANKNVIAQHQEAIRTAKQATLDIVAQQKAKAQADRDADRKALQALIAEDQKARTSIDSDVQNPLESLNHEVADQLNEGAHQPQQQDTPPQSNSPSEDPSPQNSPVNAVPTIAIPPSLADTIAQLHQDATLIHTHMQTDILQTLQQPSQQQPTSSTDNHDA